MTMTTNEKIDALAAAVAGLLHEVGTDAVRLGRDGYIIGYHDGAIDIDGEPIVPGVTPAEIQYLGEEEPRP